MKELKLRSTMKCEECPYLVKAKSVEMPDSFDLHCTKYNLDHAPVSARNMKYLHCAEGEKRR